RNRSVIGLSAARMHVSWTLWSMAGILFAAEQPQTPAAAGYVEPSTCAECHRHIAENYARTGMGRGFRSAGADSSLPEFESAPFSHAGSGERFTPVRRGGKYYVRRE